jgi:DNA-binding PadR family transcriptional regulator
MERRGWLEAEWGESELGQRAKLYRLTRAGRSQLAAETSASRALAAGVSKILLAQ